MAETIRAYAEIGEGVTIRAWQSLPADGSWSPDTDRAFPMVDVRCGPPRTDDSQTTLSCECAVLMGTKTDDDRDHAAISALYDAVQELVDKLFAQFRTTAGTELTYFLARIAAEVGAAGFVFGGLTFGEGLAPSDEDGVNMIGVVLNVHYSRSDF